jgi:hypothetical protein
VYGSLNSNDRLLISPSIAKALPKITDILLKRHDDRYSDADALKLFLPVRGFQDCLKFKSDLNRLVDWYGPNSLDLNVGKCKSNTFSRLRPPVELPYMLM